MKTIKIQRVKIQLNEIMKKNDVMKVEFNEEIEMLKKSQIRMKLKMKYSAIQVKFSEVKHRR